MSPGETDMTKEQIGSYSWLWWKETHSVSTNVWHKYLSFSTQIWWGQAEEPDIIYTTAVPNDTNN